MAELTLKQSIKFAKLHAEALTRAKFQIKTHKDIGASGLFRIIFYIPYDKQGNEFMQWFRENDIRVEFGVQSYNLNNFAYEIYCQFLQKKGFNISFQSTID